MKSNPIATPGQHRIEKRALELTQHPSVVRTRNELREAWLKRAAPSHEMRACFDPRFEEVMFCAVAWSLNRDVERPEVLTITRLAHRLDGLAIPGSRYGLDNPDSVYRIIPIDGDERYQIRGRVPERRLTENYFTLWDTELNTVGELSGDDLALDSERRFTITVDRDQAAGRPNHIRSSPKAREFFIRDVLLDWEADEP
ncbi:MAG: hypothetical protein JRH16_18185, partial [Deltaproteobacteria bacterium]|nr:hypothetical protein [Deltaproteobacteria bacterium]